MNVSHTSFVYWFPFFCAILGTLLVLGICRALRPLKTSPLQGSTKEWRYGLWEHLLRASWSLLAVAGALAVAVQGSSGMATGVACWLVAYMQWPYVKENLARIRRHRLINTVTRKPRYRLDRGDTELLFDVLYELILQRRHHAIRITPRYSLGIDHSLRVLGGGKDMEFIFQSEQLLTWLVLRVAAEGAFWHRQDMPVPSLLIVEGHHAAPLITNNEFKFGARPQRHD